MKVDHDITLFIDLGFPKGLEITQPISERDCGNTVRRHDGTTTSCTACNLELELSRGSRRIFIYGSGSKPIPKN